MKFMIFAPFWNHPDHVGNYRVERFLRWLQAKRIPAVVICDGDSDHAKPTEWGAEIAIRDPLGIYRNARPSGHESSARSRRNPMVKWTAKQVLCPDPLILWTHRAARHPLVRNHSEGVTHVLASSPPESPHLASTSVARRHGAKLIVDLRDGWLDEPLKPELQRSRFRRWRESRLESRVLQAAECIFVTSDVWKEMLTARLALDPDKVVILTNAYPVIKNEGSAHRNEHVKLQRSRLQLVHTGRFTGSSISRHPRHLLEPLLAALDLHPAKGDIDLVGDLQPTDVAQIELLKRKFETVGWMLATRSHVVREVSLSLLAGADGLLLLSTSHAAIPSKFFEYLATGKPILAATPIGSAVSRLADGLPHVFVVDYARDSNAHHDSISAFLAACIGGTTGVVPPEFQEDALSKNFYAALKIS